MENYKLETHPDWYHPVPNMHTLILGTYPPNERSRDYSFYYPNKQNRFWPVLAHIAKTELKSFEDPDAVLERKLIMEKLNVGIQNLGKVILRKNLSANDNDIKIMEFQNLIDLINGAHSLKTIILTGYSSKTSTYRDFLKYLIANNIEFTKASKIIAGQTFKAKFNKEITCYIANSTSGSSNRKGITLANLIGQFEEALKNSR